MCYSAAATTATLFLSGASYPLLPPTYSNSPRCTLHSACSKVLLSWLLARVQQLFRPCDLRGSIDFGIRCQVDKSRGLIRRASWLLFGMTMKCLKVRMKGMLSLRLRLRTFLEVFLAPVDGHVVHLVDHNEFVDAPGLCQDSMLPGLGPFLKSRFVLSFPCAEMTRMPTSAYTARAIWLYSVSAGLCVIWEWS